MKERILSLMKDILRSRLTLLFALLAISALAFAGPPLAAIPPYCNRDFGIVRFYSDATHTTQVGSCWKSCIQCYWTCSGQGTGYQVDDINPCEDPYGY